MAAHVTDNVNDAVPPFALFQTPPRVPKDKAVPKPASVAASLIAPKPPCKPLGASMAARLKWVIQISPHQRRVALHAQPHT